jgi:hypothetical protein
MLNQGVSLFAASGVCPWSTVAKILRMSPEKARVNAFRLFGHNYEHNIAYIQDKNYEVHKIRFVLTKIILRLRCNAVLVRPALAF